MKKVKKFLSQKVEGQERFPLPAVIIVILIGIILMIIF